MWILAPLAACSPSDTPTPIDETGAATVNADPSAWPTSIGGDRPAKVVAPVRSYQGGTLPLVLLLHGYGADAALQDLYFGLSAEVEARGFVLLLPDGTVDSSGARFWNATPACCDFDHTGVDDVAYLTSLLDEAEASLPVDPERVVVLGHSNGGFMAHRLACDAPDRFPAIADLAGATFWDPADCPSSAPVALLHMHGDADVEVLYDGVPLEYPSAEETVARIAARDGCAGDPQTTGTADDDTLVDGEETELLAYQGCSRDVRFWHLRGSGHIPAPTERYRADLLDWLLGER